jgi:GT2 family glycosyltransferase
MDLSVIVVTYNSAAYIDACLASLEARLAPERTEICVVDNASTDRTREIVAHHESRVRVVANPRNLGFAAALNRGLAATRGRHVLWVNPDATLENGGAQTLVAYLDAHPEVGILGPKILDPDGRLQRSARAFPSYDWPLGHRHGWLTRLFPGNPFSARYLLADLDPSTVREVDWVSGACLLHRREVAERVGGLDERFFMYCEDVDFCLRAKRAGWAVRYHPALTVRHHVAGSTRQQSTRMLVERHRSLWRYYQKHFPRHPLIDAVAWSGIWGRLAVVITAHLAMRPFRQPTRV